MKAAIDRLVERLGGLAADNRASCSARASAASSTRSRTPCASPMPSCRAFPQAASPAMPASWSPACFAGQPVLHARRPRPLLRARRRRARCARRSRRWPASASSQLILTNAAGSLRPGHAARLGDADHRPHQFLRRQSADRRAERPRFVGLTEAYDARHARGASRRRPKATGIDAAQGRLHVVLRAVLRDAGRDPHGAHPRAPTRSACRPCRR